MKRIVLCLLLHAVGGLLLPGAAGAEGDSYADARERLLRLTERGAPESRAKAFEALRSVRDVRGIRLARTAVMGVLEERARVSTRLRRELAAYERSRTKTWEAEERTTKARRRGMSRGRVTALERKLRQARAQRTRTFEELKRSRLLLRTTRTQLSSAAQEVGALLRRVSVQERPVALALIREGWLAAEDPEQWIAGLDALLASDLPAASTVAGSVVSNVERPMRLRALALDTLTMLDDRAALGHARREIQATFATHWHLVAASIRALRIVRAKEGIPLLITFLERKHIARLREDAHAALISLTGQKHGPYAGPWKTWWEDHGATFVVPVRAPSAVLAADEGSSTAFYGIHTFSDRMAFVFDASGSMWNHGEKKTLRIDVARRQLLGAVGTLDASRRFTVVPFGTQATYWRKLPVPGTESEKKSLARWAGKLKAMGQTNAYDALDLAFGLARSAEARPAIDTVFFLTDGQATTGPLDDTPGILADVRIWARLERVRLHCVGIGSHDRELLAGLALLGDGQYAAR